MTVQDFYLFSILTGVYYFILGCGFSMSYFYLEEKKYFWWVFSWVVPIAGIGLYLILADQLTIMLSD